MGSLARTRKEMPVEEAAGPAAPARHRGALGWIAGDAPEPVAAARGFYLLRQWGAAAALLQGLSGRADARLILALSRARLGEEAAALAAFAEAIEGDPNEPHARCAYAAFLLRCGRAPEALEQAEAGLGALDAQGPPAGERPATGERPGIATEGVGAVRSVLLSLRGGARWLRGREALQRGRARQAGSEFEQAARAFVAAASVSALARPPLPERLAAAYVGQAVAMVAAEQFAAAPQLYARRRAQGMTPSPALARFARDLFELCDLATRLNPAERKAAGEALLPVVTRAAMTTSLWDGAHPVILSWSGLPAEPGRS